MARNKGRAYIHIDTGPGPQGACESHHEGALRVGIPAARSSSPQQARSEEPFRLPTWVVGAWRAYGPRTSTTSHQCAYVTHEGGGWPVKTPFEQTKPDYLLWGCCSRWSFSSASTPAMHPHRMGDRGRGKHLWATTGVSTRRQEHRARQLPLWPVVDSSRCLHLASAPP
jgi:hypothetical protein